MERTPKQKGICEVILRWIIAATSIFLLFIASCSRADVEKRHQQAVIDGYTKLPIAESLRNKYGAWSFITHWNIPNDSKNNRGKNEKDWQSLTYVYGRYELIYIQRIILESNGGDVISVEGKPQLLVKEISNVFGDSNAPTTDFSDFQITIEGEKLDKLVEENWNFEVIGITLKKSEPLKNIHWKNNYWNRIYPLQQFATHKY